MATNLKMKAPEGVGTANIKGHNYKIPKNGVIDVVSPLHVPVLRRHGFTDVASDGLAKEIESTNDKARLVEIIEEHGGDADTEMKLGKLRRLAREAVSDDEDEEEDDDSSEDEDDDTEAKPAKRRGRKSKKG